MMLRDVQFCFFVSSLIFIAPIFAQNKDAKKWFKDDEVSTPDTETHFRNRRTVNGTSSAPYFQRTTGYSIPPAVEVSTQKTRVPSPTNTPTYNFTEDVAHNLTSDLKNFGKYITSNGSSEEENEVNDEYIYDFASVLMFEIFAMATGNHLVIPPNEDGKLEEKQQECAWAVAQLRLNLCYAENVVDILIKVIEETVTQYNSTGKLQAVKNMQEVLRTLFNKLNDTIEHNDFLSSKYKEERIRYLARHSHNADTRHKVYLSLDNVTRGEIDRRALIAFVNDVDIRKCFMHGQFISIMRTEFSLMEFAHLFRNEGDKNRIMRAYITVKVANEERCVSQMQNLYTAAWNETVKNFDAAVRMERNVWFLLDKLSKSVEADSVLKNKWTKQENDVREKLREKQTLR